MDQTRWYWGKHSNCLRDDSKERMICKILVYCILSLVILVFILNNKPSRPIFVLCSVNFLLETNTERNKGRWTHSANRKITDFYKEHEFSKFISLSKVLKHGYKFLKYTMNSFFRFKLIGVCTQHRT